MLGARRRADRRRGGDGITYYWPTGGCASTATFRPRAAACRRADRLRQPRSGAPMSGHADIAPYAAGGARLRWRRSASPRAATAGPKSTRRAARRAVLRAGGSGPAHADRRRFGPAARFASANAASTRASPASRWGPSPWRRRAAGLPDRRAILSARRAAFQRRRCTANVRASRPPRPVAVRADGGRRGCSTQTFDGSDRGAHGPARCAGLINAMRWQGSNSRRGSGGTFAGGDGDHRQGPAAAQRGGGQMADAQWRFDVDGGLLLPTAPIPPKFYPLRSDNMRFHAGQRMIRATGTLKHPASGTKVTDVTIEPQPVDRRRRRDARRARHPLRRQPAAGRTDPADRGRHRPGQRQA